MVLRDDAEVNLALEQVVREILPAHGVTTAFIVDNHHDLLLKRGFLTDPDAVLSCMGAVGD